jgi:hypothetical protein
MMEILIGSVPDIHNVRLSDVIGLWEVIRITRAGEDPVYPWIKGRFLFNFMDEMMFSCIKEGAHSNGTWELASKTWESVTQFSIKLNDTFEYMIIDIDEDEMIITDGGSRYLLDKKL